MEKQLCFCASSDFFKKKVFRLFCKNAATAALPSTPQRVERKIATPKEMRKCRKRQRVNTLTRKKVSKISEIKADFFIIKVLTDFFLFKLEKTKFILYNDIKRK